VTQLDVGIADGCHFDGSPTKTRGPFSESVHALVLTDTFVQ